MKVTFLGPVGATFSHQAYDRLSEEFKVPQSTNFLPARNNSEILDLIIKHGGYGAIAMETLAEGRVAEPLESFIGLLKKFGEKTCPIQVIGAIRLKLHFCLMVRPGVLLGQINKVVAHPKALGACRKNIQSLKVEIVSVPSNGEASRLIAESDEYQNSAALAPRSAAQKYGLTILDSRFEDEEAITTFFLIGPKRPESRVDEPNRCLIVFQIPHQPGSLVKALSVFDRKNLNLTQVHSVHVGNHTYHFAVEVEVLSDQLNVWPEVIDDFRLITPNFISFGPFVVLS